MTVAGALDDLAAKTFDLVSRHLAKVGIQRIAGLELFAVDQQRARTRDGLVMFIEVSEQLETAILNMLGAVLIFDQVTGNEVVDELGSGRVVADDDETRWHPDAFLFP